MRQNNFIFTLVENLCCLVADYAKGLKANFPPEVNNARLYLIYKTVGHLSNLLTDIEFRNRESFDGDCVMDYGELRRKLMMTMDEFKTTMGVVERRSEGEVALWNANSYCYKENEQKEQLDVMLWDRVDNYERLVDFAFERVLRIVGQCENYNGENAKIVFKLGKEKYDKSVWIKHRRVLEREIARRLENVTGVRRGEVMEEMLEEVECQARGLSLKWLDCANIGDYLFRNRQEFSREDLDELFHFINTYTVVDEERHRQQWGLPASECYNKLFVNRGAEELMNELAKAYKWKDGIFDRKYDNVALLFVMMDLGMTPHPASNGMQFSEYVRRKSGIEFSNDTVNNMKAKLNERHFGIEESSANMQFTDKEYERIRKSYQEFFGLLNTVFGKTKRDGFAKWVFEGEGCKKWQIERIERLKEMTLAIATRK